MVVEFNKFVSGIGFTITLPIVVRTDEHLVDPHFARDFGGDWGWEVYGIDAARCTWDRPPGCIMAQTRDTVEGSPVSGDVGSTATLHAGAGRGSTCRPTAAITVRAIDHDPHRILQPQGLTAVVQRTVVELIGSDIRHDTIIAPFEKEETVACDGACQVEVDIPTIGQRPISEVDLFSSGIVKLDPLIVC